jgi:DNA-binding NtrC family response regulator
MQLDRFSVSGGASDGASAVPGHRKPTVLILEDDSCSALALTMLLEGAGCRVHICATSELARTFIPLHLPDVLIADWSVQGASSSLEVAQQMRRINPRLRVFFVSGHQREAIESQVGDLRGECWIFEKPLDYDSFVEQVLEVLGTPELAQEQPLGASSSVPL